MPNREIVRAAIYPSIGIARVGNSPDGCFVGPEVADPPSPEPGALRDHQGRLKRQAARFRVYGLNSDGEIVTELTGSHARQSHVSVTWQVELANTKASWYCFQIALDIPEADYAPSTLLRNPTVAERSQLAITPGPRSVTGCSSSPQRFDTGRFLGKPVYLGEIATDEAGRLIVLGGHGVSASSDGSRAITFANNENWHDDVSDGPVTATVHIDGRPIEVDNAWVVVAPPNYAPMRKSVRTMWDLMRDVAIASGDLAAPQRPSFTGEILPIFERLAGLQWVNAGFAAGFGAEGAVDLTSPGVLERLSNPGPEYQKLRQAVVKNFRDFEIDGASPKPWPWLYGDATSIPATTSPRQHVMLGATQMSMLDLWVDGTFVADWPPREPAPSDIDEVPVGQQGDMLTRAALEFCLADAFHPGCEMTWTVRTATMYEAPFRFRHAPANALPAGLSAELTSDGAHMPNGPLYAQRPGDITRWMAVPWQTDTASCRSGYTPAYDPYLPAFWPARVPNQVLTRAQYDTVLDTRLPLEDRRRAFAERMAWIEPLGAIDYTTQINNMIEGFDHLGIVEPAPGSQDGVFPDHLEVEDQRRPISTEDSPLLELDGAGGTRPRSATDIDLSATAKLRRFPRGLPRDL